MPKSQGGGGGTLLFSAYVGSDPASTVHPKKISGISSNPNFFWNFSNPKNIPILYLDLKKDPKLHRNDPQTSPISWWPQKNIHKIFIPQKIFIFLKTQRNIEIQNFEPPKMVRAYVCVKISEYPPLPPPPPGPKLYMCSIQMSSKYILGNWLIASSLDNRHVGLIQSRVREGAQNGVNEVYFIQNMFKDTWINFIVKTWLLLLHLSSK